ncbi:MAG: hypothetical protein E7364_02160 [Clostridiales bacterium]|nr:hypothetical protein [Clostridiales bacterium]
MSEPLNPFEDLRERLSNGSITALIPAILYFSENCWNEGEFKDNESLLFFKQIQDNAVNLREMENQANIGTGIPHFALFMCALTWADYSAREGNQKDVQKYEGYALEYLQESFDRNFSYAYMMAGKAIFFGNGIWQKDEELGLKYLKKATELPVSEYIGMEQQAVKKFIKDEYEACLALYEKSRKENEENKQKQSGVKKSEINATVGSQKVELPVKKEKLFTSKHYFAVLAMFLVYSLLSILLRREFDLASAYEISIEKNPFLGVVATLLLNYGAVLWLLMAYFYKKNNGKHNVFFVLGYIVILIGCMADGILPYKEEISNGLLFKEKKYWINALIYPAGFLVGHRLVSLLVYAILKNKEGDLDYRIYLGFVLFAPFTAGVLLIGAIGYLFLTGQASGSSGNNGYQSQSSNLSPTELQAYVRQQIINRGGLCKFAIYYQDNTYNNGWKGVDYWDNGYSLTQVEAEWGYTCFQTPQGKIYKLPTNLPDKEKIYFFE